MNRQAADTPGTGPARRFLRYDLPLPACVLAALLASASAHAALDDAAYRRVNDSLVQHHIIPRYAKLAQTTEALRGVAVGFCRTLDAASLDAAVARALREWGRIDVLLNNGIYQGPGVMDLLLELPEEALRRVFEGNFFAQLRLTRRVVDHMLERGGGIVIDMSSTAALVDPQAPSGEGGWGFAYGASKAALHRLAGFLHVELGKRGIRAYNVDPGYVATESMREILGENDPIYQQQLRHGSPPGRSCGRACGAPMRSAPRCRRRRPPRAAS